MAAGSGYQWAFSYDPAGNLITVTDPLQKTSTYCYNLAAAPPCNTANEPGSPGTIHSATDFRGSTTLFTSYDPSGRPRQVSDPLGRVTQFGFDADGNLLFTQDPLHAAATGSDTCCAALILRMSVTLMLGMRGLWKTPPDGLRRGWVVLGVSRVVLRVSR